MKSPSVDGVIMLDSQEVVVLEFLEQLVLLWKFRSFFYLGTDLMTLFVDVFEHESGLVVTVVANYESLEVSG